MSELNISELPHDQVSTNDSVALLPLNIPCFHCLQYVESFLSAPLKKAGFTNVDFVEVRRELRYEKHHGREQYIGLHQRNFCSSLNRQVSGRQ